MASIVELERRLAALERAMPSGPMVSSAYGAGEIRPFQIGFPVVLTSTWSTTTGYSWSQRLLSGLSLAAETHPLTGDHAVPLDGNQKYKSGQAGWLEPDPRAGGWVFVSNPATGTGADKVDANGDDVNGDPASTWSQYPVSSAPTSTTPFLQFVVANDISGTSPPTPGIKQYVSPSGSGSDPVQTSTWTPTQFTMTYDVAAGATAGYTATASGGATKISPTGAWDFSSATVSGLTTGAGTRVTTALAQSNVASVSLTGLTGYNWYKVIIYDLQAKNGGGSAFWMRTSTDGGATYDSAAGNYVKQTTGLDTKLILSTAVADDTVATHTAGLEVLILNPAGTSLDKMIQWSVFTYDGANVQYTASAGLRLATADIDAIQFLMATGNLNGSFEVYGYT